MKIRSGLAAVFLAVVASAVVPSSGSAAQSQTTQAQRKASIDRLIRDRVFKKVEFKRGENPDPQGRTWARIYVTPKFYELNLAKKKRVVGLVHDYAIGKNDWAIVWLIDGRTEKEVGQFTTVRGLQMGAESASR